MREITFGELKQLQSEGKKLLVDFKARWCVPCGQLLPRLDKMSSKYGDIEFVFIDVDDNSEGCLELGIRTVPTIMIYDGENLINRSMGANIDSVYTKILDTL
jgi:thioredoxin 1